MRETEGQESLTASFDPTVHLEIIAFVQSSNEHAAKGPLVRRERLGGLLNYYYREAA